VQIFDATTTVQAPGTDVVDRLRAVNLDVDVEAITLPLRPCLGSAGTPVRVLTNHYKTSLDGNKVLYQYDVAIAEASGQPIDKLPALKSRLILKAALAQARSPDIPALPVAYDGQKTLFTVNDTVLGGTRTLTARLERKGGGKKKKEEEQSFDEYRVQVQMVGERRMTDIVDYVQGRDTSARPQDMINALDVVMKEEALKRCVEIGRAKFFSPENPATIFNGLFHAYRGFFQSLRPTQSGLTLNVDQAVAAVMRDQPLEEFVGALLHMDAPPRRLDERQARAVSKAVKGLKIEVTHRSSGRIYTVMGLSPQPADQIRFMNEEVGAEQTIAAYFQSKYKKQLRYPSLHCVRMGSKRKPTFFPIEVCKVVAGQRIPEQFIPNVAADIVDIAAVPPSNRFNKVYKQVQAIAASGKLAAQFGLKLETKVLRVQGRFLPSPRVRRVAVKRGKRQLTVAKTNIVLGCLSSYGWGGGGRRGGGGL
jgi:eukaryotic translation initiation factor 2C